MHYAGLTMDEVRARLRTEVDALRGEIASLMVRAVDAGSEAMEGRRGGRRRAQSAVGQRVLARHGPSARDVRPVRAEDAADAPARVSNQAEGVRIFIGGESQVVPFEELSVVSALTRSTARWSARWVIGPRACTNRMIQIVDITSKLVSNALSHGK